MPAFDAHANFASSLVVTAPSPANSGTSLTVTSGQGSYFPAVPFNATICPASTLPTQTNAEIVRVTAISTDTLTITRAQEGTAAINVATGYYIAATITAKVITDIESTISSGGVTSATGTANEITASPATGAVTFSLPTALTFTGKTVTGGTFSSPSLTTPALGTPASGTLTNCTFPTLNQNTTGSAASLSISGQSGLMTVTGLTSVNRVKTVRDAADTILELGGSYTPTGTWTSMTLVTPALGTPASGTLTNCTGLLVSGGGTGAGSFTAYAVLCGGTTSTGAFQSVASVGTSGQVLTSNGAGALPTFQTAAGGGLTSGQVYARTTISVI